MREQADVVVVGGGSAGVAAAVAAAESGAATILVEAAGTVGGTLAGQYLEHSAGFHDVHGEQVVAGFGQRLVDRLVAYGSSPGHVRDDVGYTASRTPVNHAELALTESVLLAEAGVRVWTHAPAVAVRRDEARIAELDVATPDGLRTLRPGSVVDASGDAVIAHHAGARFQADRPARQPASLTFVLAGIDFGPLIAYLAANPGQLRAGSRLPDPSAEHVNLWGLGDLLAAGHAAGALSLRRTELHLAGWPRRGEAVVNVTRVPAGDPGTTWTGDAHAGLAAQVLEFAAWFRTYVPGCAYSRLAAVADRVGVRESRRILGDYTLTRDDVRDGRRHDDAVARGAFPIDIHAADQPGLSHTDAVRSAYDIPYRCLTTPDVTNLLAAGRCVSSTHEANGSVRITATCFATGEAAGTAAALAAARGQGAAQVDIAGLQRALAARGAG